MMPVHDFYREGKTTRVNDKGECFVQVKPVVSISTIKHAFGFYAGYLVVFGAMNFFVGHGIGGLDAGIAHAGFFLSLGCLLLLAAIPGVGIAVAVHFEGIAGQMMLLLGISHNIWTDTMIAINVVAGVVIQTALVTWLVIRCISVIKGRRMTICFYPE